MSFNSCQVPLLTYGDKVKLLNILEKENKKSQSPSVVYSVGSHLYSRSLW